MSISAIYEKGIIKPLEKLYLEDHEEIEIEIKRKKTFDRFYGKIELDERIADKIVGMKIWDLYESTK